MGVLKVDHGEPGGDSGADVNNHYYIFLILVNKISRKNSTTFFLSII